MFIGGCPGSTAGGIKVTTLVVLFAAVKSTLCGEDTTTFLRHRFDPGMCTSLLRSWRSPCGLRFERESHFSAAPRCFHIGCDNRSRFRLCDGRPQRKPDPDAASACKACPDADDVHRSRRPCLIRRGDFNAQKEKRFRSAGGQNADRVILDPLCVLHRGSLLSSRTF